MKQNIYFLDYKIVKIKLIGIEGLDSLLKDYSIEFTEIEQPYDYQIELLVTDNIPQYFPQSSKLMHGIAMVPYYQWFSDDNRLFLLCLNEYEYGGHMLVRMGKKVILYIANNNIEFANQWLLRTSREILFQEAKNSGFVAMHAACAVQNESAILFFGSKGHGKSTALLTYTKKFGFKPLSNDIVFLKKSINHNYEVLGFPFKISIGNALFNILNENIHFSEKSDNKIFFKPKEFCEWVGSEWAWESKLYKLCYVNLSIYDPPNTYNMEAEKSFSLLCDQGIENSKWEDCLQICNCKKDIKNLLFDVSHEIPCFELSGNIFDLKYQGV